MRTLDPQSTSTSLLQHVRIGDELAWFRLVETYTPLIESWARQLGIRSSDFDDIIQNVFAALSQHIQEFGREQVENSFRAWLWTITRSKAMDHLRLTKKSPQTISVENIDNLQSPDRLADSRHDSDSAPDSDDYLNTLVQRALEVIRLDFTKQTWTAFWQVCAMGKPPSEVAKEMGMTTAAVGMCRIRVMRRLRETIEAGERKGPG